MKNNKTKLKLFSVVLLIGFVLGFSFMSVSAAFSYSSSIQKETWDLTVSDYDENTWNTTIGLGPEDYFGTEANKSGATGKLTVRSWYQDTVNTSELFFNFLISPIFLETLANSPYNSSYIDSNYTKEYEVRKVLTTSPFLDNSSLPHIAYILKEPSDLKTLYDNFSSYVETVKNDPTVPVPIESLSEEGFLFKTFIRFSGPGMGVASSIDGYLSELVSVFNNENITKGNSRLILNLNDLDNYTVQIHFADSGIKTSINFLDEDDTVFYKISSSQENWVVWVLVGVPSAIAIAVVAYILFRRYQRNKAYKESLKEMKS